MKVDNCELLRVTSGTCAEAAANGVANETTADTNAEVSEIAVLQPNELILP